MPTTPKKLAPISPGKILLHQFMEPLGISQNRLARDIDVPTVRIHQIVHEKRSITADTALRLGEYFHTTAQFWLNMQMHYDLRIAERDIWPQIQPRIQHVDWNIQIPPEAHV